ncbi:unnamed protein product [Mycena citricolor]|uniref:DUF5745 domain-containing protein n=1 Tax=Mycena citricolor TaxID=2018698 RepID=A0AAD2H9V3_9AGAR|nr:unnamed protein product [Mycena citricolor]
MDESTHQGHMEIFPSATFETSFTIPRSTLLPQLRDLLSALDMPFTLETHEELTPSLLIRLLEALLQTRLLLPADLRHALYHGTDADGHATVQCMKIFLGVLQADVLQTDVGLSALDPRKLARGGQEETLFVARLLCWYARRLGIVGARRTETPETGSVSVPPSSWAETSVVETNVTDVTSFGEVDADEDAEDEEEEEEEEQREFDELAHLSTPLQSSPPHPRCIHDVSDMSLRMLSDTDAHCIHEVPSPSKSASPRRRTSTSTSTPSAIPSPHRSHSPHPPDANDASPTASYVSPSSSPRVRYTGYIGLVDEDAEIAAFERERDAARARRLRTDASPTAADLERERRRGIALLLRKADLLEQLVGRGTLPAG